MSTVTPRREIMFSMKRKRIEKEDFKVDYLKLSDFIKPSNKKKLRMIHGEKILNYL